MLPRDAAGSQRDVDASRFDGANFRKRDARLDGPCENVSIELPSDDKDRS